MNGKKGWLACKANRGMFDDEFSVVSETSEGKTFSLFARNEILKEQNKFGDNYLSILIYSINGATFDIVLPVEPFETNQIVTVNKDQVVVVA